VQNLIESSFEVELYGQCRYDAGDDRPVIVSVLSNRYCRLRDRLRELKCGARIRLWIGAIGPIDSIVSRDGPEGQQIDFIAPLDPAIVKHFAAC
jgi:hypothetical protein